jgi:hypothetical protein
MSAAFIVLFLFQLLTVSSQDAEETCGSVDKTLKCSNSIVQGETLLPSELKVGELVPLGENAFEIGVPPELIDELIAWGSQRSILGYYHDLQDEEIGPMEPADEDEVTIRGYYWLQYRDDNEATDAHYFVPDDEISFSTFLSLLQAGGMDEILAKIGEYLKWESLTVYQAEIFGYSIVGERMVNNLGKKNSEMVIPLLVPASASPGVHVSPNFTATYRPSSAIVLSDGARLLSYEGDMFVGIHLFIADISEANLTQIKHTKLRSAYPQDEHLMGMSHWNRSDPSKGLPTPIPTAGDFVAVNSLKPGQVEYLRWAGDPDAIVHDFGLQVGLPPELTQVLRRFCDEVGITETFRDLLIQGHAIKPGTDTSTNFNGTNWYIQRPDSAWSSNMHWISPHDKDAQDFYLEMLSIGGFDQVLNGIGTFFDLEGLVAYQVTFIGVSHCEEGFPHYDFFNTDGRAFNVIIPLFLANDTVPELDVMDPNGRRGSYKYRVGAASVLGDNCIHATSAVDYRRSHDMRIAATVYIADIRPDNVERIMKEYTQSYPPRSDSSLLLTLAATHWQRADARIRLPRRTN